MSHPFDRQCKICGKSLDLFTLHYEPDDTDAQEEYDVYVCGSCWDVISTIARRIAKGVLEKAMTP